MKFVGLRDGRETLVAAVVGDALAPLADVRDFYADLPRWTAEARAVTRGERPLAGAPLAPPVPPSARVLCLGLNYRAHADEGVYGVPDHPTIFGRWTPSLSVGDVPVPVPANEPGLDWEGEVAAVVGTRMADVDAAAAEAGVLGYAVFNDLTARTAQKLTAQWTLGKNADRSGPMGPLVTADEVGSLAAGLDLTTRVNGEVVQHGSTRDMIFGVGDVLSLVSRTLTLEPGDVLVTGTPEGVGYVRTPPWLLRPGDVVEVEVEKLGLLRTPICGAGGR
ncbi:fumarylacetoacetate hydrolase family protein [Pseudonocardia kunmingensis]|uniref:2-keto-4-pentenoate hydratase/2-oxohepta-3-ene-1,7-dioic acid hydratase in catechol pathway n=1 Tax=Pseudonocardia kunmingensis TaxID=630975 RepID=A0A543D0Z6_9PSEU|nr:fumarylacetoacetate hydrolase family protein [Pseudonocardia kunmingensis]TQM02997.1 2-keto-4-pentenoate hydratase/2-oxohepta-3-ene-1,7-dioic acid hydratase in catechol pathway [Pseudonocardia kunmingensis]